METGVAFRRDMLRTSQRVRGIVALASAAVLLLAVLPNILYIGHLPIPGVAAYHEHPSSAQEARDDASHCHYGPAGCSDHSHPSTSSWSLPAATEVAMVSTATAPGVFSDAPDVTQAISARSDKPPQPL